MFKFQTLLSMSQHGRANNLNAIRLLLAVLVIFSHSFPLATGRPTDPLTWCRHDSMTLGFLAVDLFFFISGMLITASWLNCSSMNDYLRRRILRIVPGYLCGLFLGFMAALLFAAHPFADWRHKLGRFRDVFSLGFNGVEGDWIFSHNPFPHAANGSLWTISREFHCYLLVAIIGLVCCFKHRRLLLTAWLGITSYYVLRHFPAELSPWRFFSIFMTGVCAWLWRDKIPLHGRLAAVALLVFLASIFWSPLGILLMTYSACYLVIWGGYTREIKALSWCNRIDLSYGTYLYAFPLQQTIAALGVTSPWIMFALVLPPVLLLALASWFLVEKPALSLKFRHASDYDPVQNARAN